MPAWLTVTALLSLAITGLCGVEQALVGPQTRFPADLVPGGPRCSQFENGSLRRKALSTRRTHARTERGVINAP
jgi:hypothetical protein